MEDERKACPLKFGGQNSFAKRHGAKRRNVHCGVVLIAAAR